MRITHIFACLLVSAAARAAESPTACGNLDRIEQIKAFVTCQGSPALAACGGLGGLVAGRAASVGLQKRYLRLMDAAQDTLARDIAEAARDEARAPRRMLDPKQRLTQVNADVARGNAHLDLLTKYRAANAKENRLHLAGDDMNLDELNLLVTEHKPLTDEMSKAARDTKQNPIRAGDRYREKMALEAALKRNPAGPIFEPLLARIPGDDMRTFDVANLPYDDLPEPLRHGYDLRAKTTADLIRARVASGLPVDDAFLESAAREVHAEWMKDYRRRPRQPANGLIDADDLARAELERSKAMVRRGAGRLRELETATLARGLGPAIKVARKLGAAGPLAVGGILGASLFAAGQIAGADAAACAEADAPYVHRDPNQNCRPSFEVDARVAGFLALTPREQKEVLVRFPDVCAYYGNLHQTFFAQPKFTGLSCQSVGPDRSRVIITARDADDRPREYRVDVRGEDTVSAVGVYSGGGMKVRLYNFANANEELTSKLGADSGAGRELRQVKLFVPEAVQCCASRDPACAASFGAGVGAADAGGSRPAPTTSR